MRNCILAIGLVLTSQFLSGCGSAPTSKREPVFPVSGKVSYKGQPVAGADVTFFCKEKNMSSFAKTDAEGKFKLTTFASFDGAPAGKYSITVSKPAQSAAATKDVPLEDPSYNPDQVAKIGTAADVTPKSPIPVKYADAKSTDLFATVTADSQTPEVNLTLQD